MSLTGQTIQYLQQKFPNASFMKDIILQDDGNGPYVKYWFGQPIPDEATLNAEAAKFVAPPNYPTVDAQLKMLYNDQKYGTHTFSDTIDAYNAQLAQSNASIQK